MKKQQYIYCSVICLLIVFGVQSLSLYAATDSPTKNTTSLAAVKAKTLSDIQVTHAVVYVPLGSSQATVAFFTFHNNSDHPISITKVTSPTIKKITLTPALPTAAGAANPWLVLAHQTLELNPANQYLQLTGLKNSLTTGDELQLDVSLNNGKKLLVIARAKSAFDQIHGH